MTTPPPPPPPPLCFLLNIAGSFSPQALQLRVSSPFSFHLYLLTCQRGLLCNSELTLLPAAEMSFPLSIKQLPEAFAARSTPHLLPQTWGCCRASGRPLVDRKLTAGRDSFLETKGRFEAVTCRCMHSSIFICDLTLFLIVACRLGTMRSMRRERREERPHIHSRATPAKVFLLTGTHTHTWQLISKLLSIYNVF